MGWNPDRHANDEKSSFRLLELLDFDKKMGVGAIVDIATQGGGIESRYAMDRVRAGSFSICHAEDQNAAFRVREGHDRLPKLANLGASGLPVRIPGLELEGLRFQGIGGFPVQPVQQGRDLGEAHPNNTPFLIMLCYSL